MRFTLRGKLIAIVATAALALVVLVVASSLATRQVRDQLAIIRDRHLPRAGLRPLLEGQFDRLRRGIQDAVAAQDLRALEDTRTLEAAFQSRLAKSRRAMDRAHADALGRAVHDYAETARAVSRRLIAGEMGESLVDAIAAMQEKQARATERLAQATTFDPGELTRAFRAVSRAQEQASRIRLVASLGCLALVVLLTLWLTRGMLRSLAELTTGLERFGRGDFGRKIPIASRDELGAVAERANEMAESLARLGEERSGLDWLRAGQVGLAEELRGELRPDEVAGRAVEFLTKTLEVPVAAFYVADASGTLRLAAQHAAPGGPVEAGAVASFRLGEGLVGQAALRKELSIVDDPPEGYLRVRSGLGESRARAIVLLPLVHAARVAGVVELASFRRPSAREMELLKSIAASLAIAVGAAQGREDLRRAHAELEARHEELHQTNEELRSQQEEVRAQSEALARSQTEIELRNEELASATKHKSDFLAHMSHELRTPLNAIIGFSDLLQEGMYGPLAPDQVEPIRDVLAAGRQLLAIINDVLDLSKIEAGRLDARMVPLDVADPVREAVEMVRAQAASKGITLENHVAPRRTFAHADPDRLRQILLNLLSNGVKFTPDNGRVTVAAHVEGDSVDLGVSDTGIGISEADARKLFQPFTQIESGTARRYGGTGLGLSISASLARLMGGSMSLDSRPGEGSTFRVRLRRADASLVAAEEPRREAPVDPGTRGEVLVVEDVAADARVVEGSLQHAGYTVRIARTAEEALAALAKARPDLLVVDLALPGLSGLGLVDEVRARYGASLPILVLTGIDVDADMRARLEPLVQAIEQKGRRPRADFLEQVARLRAGSASARSARVTIVVADDSDVNRRVAVSMLARYGCTLVEASDGVAALECIRRERPAAVLLDIGMPGMDGVEVLRRLRNEAETRAIKVVAVTGHTMRGDAARFLAEGFDAFVAKPVARADLVAALDQVLGGESWRPSRPADGAE